MTTWRETAICGAVGLAFGALLLMPYLHGHWRLADDAYLAYLQRYVLQERILKVDGAWEHWILNVGAGQPGALMAGQTLFYPVQVLWGLLVGWSEMSYVYYLLLHVWAATWFGAVFARQAGLSPAASLFFAMSFAGNGYVLGTLSNPNLMLPHLFWPVLISGLLDLHLEGGKHETRGVAKIAVGSFLVEVTSYPLLRILIFGSTAIGYWLMSRKRGTWFEGVRFRPVLIGGALGALGSAPEWISTLPVLKLADRLNENIYDEYTYNSPTNFLVFATSLLPGVFDRRDVTQIGMLWLERTWWVGSLTLGLIFAGMRTRALSLKKLHVPLAIVLFAFLFSMGGHTFVRELSAIILPPLEHLRHSDYARFLVMTFLAYVGALSLDAIAAKPPAVSPEAYGRRVSWLWAAFFVACCAAALVDDFDLHQVKAPHLYSHGVTAWKIQSLHTAFYLLLGYTAYAFRVVLFGRWTWPVVVAALQFISMADAGYAFRRLVATETPYKPKEEFALPAVHPNERSMKRWFDGDDWTTWEGNKMVLWGYNPPYHYLRSKAYDDPVTQPMLASLVSCRDNAQFALGAEASALRSPASDLSCAGLQFQIDHYFGNTIEISGSGAKPALIVAHDLFDSYWTVQVNGETRPVLRAFNYFKAAEVPAGNWKVRFEYRNPWFPFLWFASAAGLALVLGLKLWYPRLARALR